MQDRESVLQKKATQIQEELKRWAKAQHLLQVGEQIEFVMSIKDIPIVVPKIIQGILGISIPKFLTIERCQALGISSRTRNILVGRIYGTVDLGNWREESIYREIITVGDLIKLSKKTDYEHKESRSAVIFCTRDSLTLCWNRTPGIS